MLKHKFFIVVGALVLKVTSAQNSPITSIQKTSKQAKLTQPTSIQLLKNNVVSEEKIPVQLEKVEVVPLQPEKFEVVQQGESQVTKQNDAQIESLVSSQPSTNIQLTQEVARAKTLSEPFKNFVIHPINHTVLGTVGYTEETVTIINEIIEVPRDIVVQILNTTETPDTSHSDMAHVIINGVQKPSENNTVSSPSIGTKTPVTKTEKQNTIDEIKLVDSTTIDSNKGIVLGNPKTNEIQKTSGNYVAEVSENSIEKQDGSEKNNTDIEKITIFVADEPIESSKPVKQTTKAVIKKIRLSQKPIDSNNHVAHVPNSGPNVIKVNELDVKPELNENDDVPEVNINFKAKNSDNSTLILQFPINIHLGDTTKEKSKERDVGQSTAKDIVREKETKHQEIVKAKVTAKDVDVATKIRNLLNKAKGDTEKPLKLTQRPGRLRLEVM